MSSSASPLHASRHRRRVTDFALSSTGESWRLQLSAPRVAEATLSGANQPRYVNEAQHDFAFYTQTIRFGSPLRCARRPLVSKSSRHALSAAAIAVQS